MNGLWLPRPNLCSVCDGDVVSLPTDLIGALTSGAGGTIALVLGAGCSIDQPTGLKTAGAYSAIAYRRLVEARVIEEGCCDPGDLGALADAVFAATSSQQALVDILKPELENAAPNEGHKIAAALLAEQVIGSIITLNFDRSLDAAIAEMARGERIAIVHAIEDIRGRTRFLVIYLHGNVESPAEKWVLRKAQIDSSWEEWQKYVVVEVALTPHVVFAGLGSATPVISDTVLKVNESLPAGKKIYQVDTVDSARNALAQTLKIDADDYVIACWTGFMRKVGETVAREFLHRLSERHPHFCFDNHHAEEDIVLTLSALPHDLLELGRLRAAWFFDKSEYKMFRTTNVDHLVDIVRTVGIALRIAEADECVLVDDGMELRRDGNALARVFSCSGAGAAYWAKIEAEMHSRLSKFRRHDKTTPVVYLVTGVDMSLAMSQATSVPESIVPKPVGDELTASPPDFAYFTPQMLQSDPKPLLDMMRN